MKSHNAILWWLYTCCFMVFAIAVIGAITRLTESGLSMTEWKPVTGWLPPLTSEEWQKQYELYQQSPEFRHKHFWMELEDFKQIFFWEWLHRLWGRLTGLVYAIPLIWFTVWRKIPKNFGKAFFSILLLGGIQGGVGWWMVVSGLIDNPNVSHFRLATHLGMAFVIFTCLWWTTLELKYRYGRLSIYKSLKAGSLENHARLSLLLLFIVIIWGAFVAGLDAGLLYNEFPMMGKTLTPDTEFYVSSIIEERGWVQFTHRWLAIFTGLIILAFAARVRAMLLILMVFVQIGLGIATLLSQVWLPLAVGHQVGAFILLMLLLNQVFRVIRS